MKRFIIALIVLVASCQDPCRTGPPPVILGSVSAVAGTTEATITWSTDDPTTSTVDYGTSATHGQSVQSLELSAEHSLVLTELEPSTTYHFKVRNVDRCKREVASLDNTFTTREPVFISQPMLVDEPDATGSSPVQVTLDWYEVTISMGGGAIEYIVEVDDDATFEAVEHSSDWIFATTFTLNLDSERTWYWRVMARDAATATIFSPWSAVDSFTLTPESSSSAPPAPTLVPEPDTMTGGGSYVVTLEWNPVTDPDGDPVEYQAQLAYSPDFSYVAYDSGWISETEWSVMIPGGGMWYWRARARDADHTDAISDWSAVDDFYDQWMPGSCPFLFVYDGDGYEYLTDIQGPAIGLPPNVLTIKNMKYYHPELVVLDGLVPDDKGEYRIKIRETQTEITYLDEVTLLVVDVPDNHSVVSTTSESTYSYGYANPLEIVVIDDTTTRAPVAVADHDGHSVIERVRTVDGRFVTSTSPDHFIVDFGSIADTGNLTLLIDGWTTYDRELYPSKTLVQPHIDVVDDNGKWVEARKFGNPAGDVKRMAIDVSDIFVSDDRRMRIDMGKVHAIRWTIDAISLARAVTAAPKTTRIEARYADLSHPGRVPLSRANLHHANIASDGGLPDNPPSLGYGSFTRYGDVLDLLDTTDDMFAIMRHGDGIEIVFPASSPPAKGMTRYFILESQLFYKHLNVSSDVTPLPYAGMTSYPYVPTADQPGWPSDDPHLTYLAEYNTRTYVQSNPP